MRRDHFDPLGDAQARRVGIDEEGGDAPGARRLAGAGEEDVVIGDAAVRDIGLGAVHAPASAVALCQRLHRGDVGAGARLGEREGGDLLAACHGGEIGLFLRLGAEQRDGARSQSLHGEGEIGQPRMARQRLADQRQRADVERLVHAAPGRRHAVAQPAAVAERADEPPAFGIHIGAVMAGEVGNAPGLQRFGQPAVAVVEKGPV